MAETVTAPMSAMDTQAAPWMAAMAEQQRKIQELMERIEILEGRKVDSQPPASNPPSSFGQTLLSQVNSENHPQAEAVSSSISHTPTPTYSSPASQWDSPEHHTPSLTSGRTSASLVGSHTRSPNPNRPQNTHTNRPASVTSRVSGGGSSAAGSAGRSKPTPKNGKNQGICRYGNKCHKQQCWYQHPDADFAESSPTEASASARPKIPCRDGSSCSRSNCWYEHPNGWNPYSASSEPPAQDEPSASEPQSTVDTWAPVEDSSNGWDSAPNLSSWAETTTTANVWGDPASDWGAAPAANSTWETTETQPHDSSALSKWGEVTSSGWGADDTGELETVTSQASSTPTPGSSSTAKGKNPRKKRGGLERRARRNASEAAATSTNTPFEQPTPTTSVDPAHEPMDELANEPTSELTNEFTQEPLDEALTSEPTHERTSEFVDEHVEEPMNEPTIEPTVEPTIEPTIEPAHQPADAPAEEFAHESAVEPAESHDPIGGFTEAETSDTQETPPLDPSASSAPSASESDTPETPRRLVWSDEPQEDFPVVDFEDLPSDYHHPEFAGDTEAGYDPEPEEAPSLDNTQSMIYSSWDNVTPSAADWGFDTSEFDTPAPAVAATPPVVVDPVPAKKSVKSRGKGKQKTIENTSAAFNYQPQNIGAPGSSSQKPVSEATPLATALWAPPPELEPEAEPAVVAPEPPQGVPEDQIPDWLLGGDVDAHEVLGISRPTTPEPEASSSSTPRPTPTGPPKISQLAGNKFPGLGESVLPRPQPKTTPAPKPIVRARPVGWKIVPSPNPPGTSTWATGSRSAVPTAKGKRTVRAKGKKPTESPSCN